MVAFHTVKAGDRLWDCHREKMGNTTMSRMESWPVDVISIDHEKRQAIVRWSNNSPKVFHQFAIERLRRSPAKKS